MNLHANHSIAELLKPYVDHIIQLLHIVFTDANRTEALLRSSMGVIGYVFVNGSYSLLSY